MVKKSEDMAAKLRMMMESDDLTEETIVKMKLDKFDHEMATRLLMCKNVMERQSVILLSEGKAMCCVDPQDIDGILCGIDRIRETLKQELVDHIAGLKAKHNI